MKFSFKREQNGVGSNSAEREKIGAKLNIFKRLQAALRLREAVRQALKAHFTTGHRYYVMPTSGTSGQLVIMDRENFRKLKQKGYINRNTFVNNLKQECFYCTPYRNGMGALSPEVIAIKRKNYINWLYSVEQLKKQKRKTETKEKDR